MKSKRHYLVVESRHRRHSAPENLGTWSPPQQAHPNLLDREFWCRASVSDFSVLVENQSESGSSLELDTSTLSRDISPILTTKTTPRDSYQNLSVIDFEMPNGNNEEEAMRNSSGCWPFLRNILLSQVMAGCLSIMSVINKDIRLNPHSVITNGQNLPHYLLLGVLWTTKLAMRNDGRHIVEVIKFSGLRYLFLSVLHVEGNYLLLSSFRHQTYLGNQTVDTIAASLSLILAFVCLEVEFYVVHIFGYALTIVGAMGLCIANAVRASHNYNDVVLGDVLRVASGLFLAFNSTAQEIIVKSIDLVEYMGMVGLMGSLICGFQAMILEGNKIIPKSSSYWLAILFHTVAQVLFSSLMPKLLRDLGATGLHLALISSTFYAYFIGVILEQNTFQLLYFLSFAVVFLGSSLFAIKRTSIGTQYFFPVKVVLMKGS